MFHVLEILISKILKRAKELNLSWPLSDDQTDAVLEQLLYSKLHNRSNRRMPDYDYIRKELLRNGVSKNFSGQNILKIAVQMVILKVPGTLRNQFTK